VMGMWGETGRWRRVHGMRAVRRESGYVDDREEKV